MGERFKLTKSGSWIKTFPFVSILPSLCGKEIERKKRDFLLPSLPTSHSQFEFIHHIRTKPEKLRLRLIEWKHRLGVTLPSLYFNPRTSILPSRIWSSSQHPFTPGYLWNLRAFVRIRGKSRSNFCPHRQAGFNFLRFPFAFSNRASFPSGPPFSSPFFFSPLLEKKNSRKGEERRGFSNEWKVGRDCETGVAAHVRNHFLRRFFGRSKV